MKQIIYEGSGQDVLGHVWGLFWCVAHVPEGVRAGYIAVNNEHIIDDVADRNNAATPQHHPKPRRLMRKRMEMGTKTKGQDNN